MPQLNVLPINVSKNVEVKDESAVLSTSSSTDGFAKYLNKNKGDSSLGKREVDNQLDENTVKKFRPHESGKVTEKPTKNKEELIATVEVVDSASNAQEVAASGKKITSESAKDSIGEDIKLPDEPELLMSFLVKADQTLTGENSTNTNTDFELSAEQQAKIEAQLLLKPSDLVANLSEVAKALKPDTEQPPQALSEQALLAKALLGTAKVADDLENKNALIEEGKDTASIDKLLAKENVDESNVDSNKSKLVIDEILASKNTKASDKNITEQQLNSAKLSVENIVNNETGDSKKLTALELKTSIKNVLNSEAVDKKLTTVDEINDKISLQTLDAKLLTPESDNKPVAKEIKLAPTSTNNTQVNISAQTSLAIEKNVNDQIAQLTQSSSEIAKQGADFNPIIAGTQNSNGKNSLGISLGQTTAQTLSEQSVQGDPLESDEQIKAKTTDTLFDQSKEFNVGENKDSNNKVATKTTSEFSVNSNFIDVTGRATQVAQQISDQQINDVFNPTGSSEVSQSQKTNAQLHQETISIFRKDFADSVKDKVMLMISQKLQQFDITLDPPELGNMQVRVNLQGEQASVNFVVQNQQAKEAFEQNMHKLKEMLAEQGVDVGDANVEQQSHQADCDDNNEEKSDSNQQSQMTNTADANDVVAHNLSAKMINSATTAVDYYA